MVRLDFMCGPLKRARHAHARVHTAYMRPATNHRVPSFPSFFVCIAIKTHICRITRMWKEVHRRAHRLEFRCSMPLSRTHSREIFCQRPRVRRFRKIDFNEPNRPPSSAEEIGNDVPRQPWRGVYIVHNAHTHTHTHVYTIHWMAEYPSQR